MKWSHNLTRLILRDRSSIPWYFRMFLQDVDRRSKQVSGLYNLLMTIVEHSGRVIQFQDELRVVPTPRWALFALNLVHFASESSILQHTLPKPRGVFACSLFVCFEIILPFLFHCRYDWPMENDLGGWPPNSRNHILNLWVLRNRFTTISCRFNDDVGWVTPWHSVVHLRGVFIQRSTFILISLTALVMEMFIRRSWVSWYVFYRWSHSSETGKNFHRLVSRVCGLWTKANDLS